MATNDAGPLLNLLSIRHPHYALVALGLKKIENRTYSTTRVGRLFLLQVSSICNWEDLKHPVVRASFGSIPELQHYSNDMLKQWITQQFPLKSICCVFRLDKIYKNETPKTYRFADVPKKTNFHWLIGDTIRFTSPICEIKGVETFRRIKDEERDLITSAVNCIMSAKQNPLIAPVISLFC